MKKIRWGILGCGSIARKFAPDLRLVNDAELIAVGAREFTTAQIFAKEFPTKNVHGNYLKQQPKRGGSGILTLSKKKDETWVGKRDIILGLNIPNYWSGIQPNLPLTHPFANPTECFGSDTKVGSNVLQRHMGNYLGSIFD